jgi:MtfA peptidase
VPLERLLGLFWTLLPWAVGAAIAATAYRLVPRLAPALHLGRPRVRYRRESVPPEWRAVVARNVPLAAPLGEAERERLLKLAQLFVRDVPFEGVGLEVTDEIRVTVAAHACLLLLRLDYPRFPTLRRILVYPGVFQPRRLETYRLGEIWQEPHPALGEAWTGGIVILSWESVLGGARDPADGQNVVLHEFAHVLDGENGAMDGVPVLERAAALRAWRRAVAAGYELEVSEVERGGDPPLHPYAATNRAEFFAVATEAFFERPAALARALPALYAALRGFYRTDPALSGPDGRRDDSPGGGMDAAPAPEDA